MTLQEFIEKQKDIADKIGYDECDNCKYQDIPPHPCRHKSRLIWKNRVGAIICPGWEKRDDGSGNE